jgi:phosphate transport system protein
MSTYETTDTRPAFHHELDAIDDAFVTIGLEVAEAMPELSMAFLSGDRDVIPRVEALATRTADACEAVDESGFILLARQAPVGGDLRRLVALLRMTVDVHRSASLLRHACVTLETCDPRFLADTVRSQLEELAIQSCEVFAAGMDAWRRRDALAVGEVDAMDENVDELQRVLLRETSRGGEELGEGMLVLGLLARYYERIADHGVEIARDAAFVATGQRVRVGSRRFEHHVDVAEESGDGGDAPGGAATDPAEDDA